MISAVTSDTSLIITHQKGEIFITRVWLPYALSDRTLSLCTLTFAAGYLEVLGALSDHSQRISYKAQAIRAINDVFRRPENVSYNSTIAAVAMFALNEVCPDLSYVFGDALLIIFAH